MRKLIILIAFCFAGLQAQDAMIEYYHSSPATGDTTNWYVSNTGSDEATGHSTDTPLQTIAGLETKLLQRGDTVFLKKGDTWREQLDLSYAGTSDSNIVITSYGTGANPIISGGEILTTWAQNGSIWASKASSDVYNLYVDGVQQVLARSPNINTWYKTANSSAAKVQAAELSAAEDNWLGTTLVLRAVNWSYSRHLVNSSKDDSVSLAVAVQWTPETGVICYIENKKELIDTTGEWYHNPATDSIYYQPATGVNPNTLTIEGSIREHGVLTAQANVRIEGLTFDKQYSSGIGVTGTPSGVRITGNTITNQLDAGIIFEGAATAATISNNFIFDAGNGILASYVTGATISNDSICRIGLYYGQQNQSYGIECSSGGDNTISRNYIDSVGYVGIFPYNYDRVDSNKIFRYCWTLDDGAGIYWGNGLHHVTIRSNIIGYGIGFHSLTSFDVAGIYSDQWNYANRIANNTIINSGNIGIKLTENDMNDTVRSNTIYDMTSEKGALFYEFATGIWQTVNTAFTHTYNSVIKNNIFYSSSNDSVYFWFIEQVQDSAINPLGTLDSNKYLNPFGNFNSSYYQIPGVRSQYLSVKQLDDSLGQTNTSGIYKLFSTQIDTLIINKFNYPVTYTLGTDKYKYFNGAFAPNSLTVPADSSVLLFHDSLTVTFDRDTIIADANDAESDDTYEYLGATIIGKDATDTYQTGLRFLSQVPQGATIVSCYIEITCRYNNGWNPSTDIVEILASDNDEALIFEEGHSHTISTHLAPLTSAIEWSGFATPGAEDELITPNLKSILQTIIDRPGYAAGKYIGFCLRAKTPVTNHNVVLYDYTDTPAKTARIVIEYTE